MYLWSALFQVQMHERGLVDFNSIVAQLERTDQVLGHGWDMERLMKEQNKCVACRWAIVSHSHCHNWYAINLHGNRVKSINRNMSSCVINVSAIPAKNSSIRM